MENFDQIFTLLAEHEGIGLNLDILETGLLNIIVVVAILVFTIGDFLLFSLKERKSAIIKSVQEAENRLDEAQKRLEETKKQLNQASIVISEIKNETLSTKKILLESDVFLAKKELKTRLERGVANFQSKNRGIFLEIRQEIMSLVFKRTILSAQETFGTSKLQIQNSENLIWSTIKNLDGDLL